MWGYLCLLPRLICGALCSSSYIHLHGVVLKTGTVLYAHTETKEGANYICIEMNS
jgi:hypothetical protein